MEQSATTHSNRPQDELRLRAQVSDLLDLAYGELRISKRGREIDAHLTRKDRWTSVHEDS